MLQFYLCHVRQYLHVTFVSADIRKRLQSSLVLIGEIGGNDYNYALFGKSVSEVEKLIPGVVRTIIDAAKVSNIIVHSNLETVIYSFRFIL